MGSNDGQPDPWTNIAVKDHSTGFYQAFRICGIGCQYAVCSNCGHAVLATFTARSQPCACGICGVLLTPSQQLARPSTSPSSPSPSSPSESLSQLSPLPPPSPPLVAEMGKETPSPHLFTTPEPGPKELPALGGHDNNYINSGKDSSLGNRDQTESAPPTELSKPLDIHHFLSSNLASITGQMGLANFVETAFANAVLAERHLVIGCVDVCLYPKGPLRAGVVNSSGLASSMRKPHMIHHRSMMDLSLLRQSRLGHRQSRFFDALASTIRRPHVTLDRDDPHHPLTHSPSHLAATAAPRSSALSDINFGAPTGTPTHHYFPNHMILGSTKACGRNHGPGTSASSGGPVASGLDSDYISQRRGSLLKLISAKSKSFLPSAVRTNHRRVLSLHSAAPTRLAPSMVAATSNNNSRRHVSPATAATVVMELGSGDVVSIKCLLVLMCNQMLWFDINACPVSTKSTPPPSLASATASSAALDPLLALDTSDESIRVSIYGATVTVDSSSACVEMALGDEDIAEEWFLNINAAVRTSSASSTDSQDRGNGAVPAPGSIEGLAHLSQCLAPHQRYSVASSYLSGTFSAPASVTGDDSDRYDSDDDSVNYCDGGNSEYADLGHSNTDKGVPNPGYYTGGDPEFRLDYLLVNNHVRHSFSEPSFDYQSISESLPIPDNSSILESMDRAGYLYNSSDDKEEENASGWDYSGTHRNNAEKNEGDNNDEDTDQNTDTSNSWRGFSKDDCSRSGGITPPLRADPFLLPPKAIEPHGLYQFSALVQQAQSPAPLHTANSSGMTWKETPPQSLLGVTAASSSSLSLSLSVHNGDGGYLSHKQHQWRQQQQQQQQQQQSYNSSSNTIAVTCSEGEGSSDSDNSSSGSGVTRNSTERPRSVLSISSKSSRRSQRVSLANRLRHGSQFFNKKVLSKLLRSSTTSPVVAPSSTAPLDSRRHHQSLVWDSGKARRDRGIRSRRRRSSNLANNTPSSMPTTAPPLFAIHTKSPSSRNIIQQQKQQQQRIYNGGNNEPYYLALGDHRLFNSSDVLLDINSQRKYYSKVAKVNRHFRIARSPLDTPSLSHVVPSHILD